jgi:hypothetical protein
VSDEIWGILREAKRKATDRRQNSLESIPAKMGVSHRVAYPMDGVLLLDGRVYYYAKRKVARIKGAQKEYQMRGLTHFIEVFAK